LPTVRLTSTIAACVLFAIVASSENPDRAGDTQLLYADHRNDDGTFFTPWAEFERSVTGFLRWKLSRSPYANVVAPPTPVVENNGSFLSRADEPASLTWVGHATYVIHDGGDVVLTDPHFTKRALIPERLVDPGLPLSSIPATGFAVVSHNHYDHLDAATVDALPSGFGWFVPLGLGEWFRERGRSDVTELDWWQSAKRGQWTVTCLPSQHWSLRLGEGENESLWCTWLLESAERRYFFAGDTGYFHGFAEFGKRFPGIDAALLPIGAYSPRWFMQYQHMDPREALVAHRELGARSMFAMHWGTFDLTDEPPGQPPVELREAVESSRIPADLAVHIHTPAIGERVVLPPRRADTSKTQPEVPVPRSQ
jgi:N-acyl-phosphatidylethanolamine-hydrolysing phospholipase D